MTEAEWLQCTDPEKMGQFLGWSVSVRKWRLYEIACCRRVWHLLSPEGRAFLDALERRADGLASKEEVEAAVAAQSDFSDEGDASQYSAADLIAIAADNGDDGSSAGNAAFERELAAQCGLLRDIFGNPCRPVRLDPRWRTPAVKALAQAFYEERRFQDLPILADALEEGGCDNAAMLSHCREPGEHVRGCWALDLLLGKT
jgi:hypothetical protein